jgi:hypothetical protein
LPQQADGQADGAPLGSQPVQRGGEPAGQQLDVEAQATAGTLGRLLLAGQQIQQQGGQAGLLELGGNQAVAGAQPAAAAPVGEQHHALGGGRYGQVGGQPHPAGGHAHALLHRGVTSISAGCSRPPAANHRSSDGLRWCSRCRVVHRYDGHGGRPGEPSRDPHNVACYGR